VPAAIRLFAQGVATLNDETGDDAVKGRAVIKSHLGQLEEIIQVTGSVFWVKANLDLAEFGRDGDTRVDFLEFHRHGGQCIKGVPSEARPPKEC
jgi:hypothetical protein